MFVSLRKMALALTLLSTGATLSAGTITLPGGSFAVPALDSAGASFTYTGTLTQSDLIAFDQIGDPCCKAR